VVLVKKTHFIEPDQHHPGCANSGSRSHPSSAEEGIFRWPSNSFTPSQTSPTVMLTGKKPSQFQYRVRSADAPPVVQHRAGYGGD